MTSALPVSFRLTVDDENTAEIFWDALRSSPVAWVEEHLDAYGFAEVSEATMAALEALDGWADGPDHAPTALRVERVEPAALPPLAIRRMTALACAFGHGWAQTFRHADPPALMEEALSAHAIAQAADPDHTIVVPSLTHTSGSGRTAWEIGEDGTVTATIYDVVPGGDDWGDYTMVPRVRLTVAADGTHTLEQFAGCDIDDLDRACRVWRAVRHVVAPTPIPADFVPEIVHRIRRPEA